MRICQLLTIILILGIIIYFVKEKLTLKSYDSKIEKLTLKSYDSKIENYIHKLSAPFISQGKVVQTKLFNKKYMNRIVLAENLRLLKQVLDKYNIKYYIDCGTLLGAIRDGFIIEGDTDADIQVEKNGIKKIRSHLPELEKLGFISFRNSNSWMAMSLLRKGEYIDLYSLFKVIPFKLVMYPFLGTYFPIPKYYDSYLTELYANWRVPTKQHGDYNNWTKGMPSYVKKYCKEK